MKTHLNSRSHGSAAPLAELLAVIVLALVQAALGQQELRVRTNYHAMVLHYNPHVWRNGEYLTVQQAYHWRDVDELCRNYIEFLKRASGGQVNFSVACKFVLDEFPPDNDPEVTFTPANYDQFLSQGYDMWNHGKADYDTLCNDPRLRIIPRVEAGEVDAIWVFPPCNCGFWETAMAGRGAFRANGECYPSVNCARKFVLYGFGTEPHQNAGYMLENTAHMAEVIMRKHIAVDWPTNHAITGWNTLNLMDPNRAVTIHHLNDWDYFTVTDSVHWDTTLVAPGHSQAGLSHFPPNALANYGFWPVELNFNGFWEAGQFETYDGSFELRTGDYWASAGHKSLLKAEFNMKEGENVYPMMAIITDADIQTGIHVISETSPARAGVLVRCSRLGVGENAARGYVVAVNRSLDRLELARVDGAYTVLAVAPLEKPADAFHDVFIRVRGSALSVSWSPGAEPVITCANLADFADGGVGLCTYGSEAIFTHFNVATVVSNYAESWRHYPSLDPTARVLTRAAWQGDDQPFGDIDYWYAWWFEHFPKNPGVHAFQDPVSGHVLGYGLNSWWPYVFDINVFDRPYLPTTNVLSATPDTLAPEPPASVRVSLLSTTSARIEWDEPHDNIGVTRYDLYRNGQWICQVPLRYAVDTLLVPGGRYTYAVKARDGSGNESPFSDTTTVVNTILRNGGFETGDGGPAFWHPETWDASAVLSWPGLGSGRDGTRCIGINVGTNPSDARWEQELTGLIPYGRYLLSGWVKGQDIVVEPGALAGASLWSCGSLGSDEHSTPLLAGTFDWTRVQCHVYADAAGQVVVACRLGYRQHGASGIAWFDDLTLEYSPLPELPVAAWGNEDWNWRQLPEGLTNAVAVAGGFLHTLALNADGAVLAWGNNYCDQLFIPAGLTSNVVAIAAGAAHNLVLKADGTVAAWGYNPRGECDVPAGLTNVVGVAAGGSFNLAVLSDGTVRAWGANDGNCLGVPAGLREVVALAAGREFGLALKADGAVLAWGSFIPYIPADVPAGLRPAIAIACGASHALALHADGTVSAWGISDHGETNVPPDLNQVIAIAAGADHSLALRADGSVAAWGGNSLKILAVPPNATNAFAIGCGARWNVVLVGCAPPVSSVRPHLMAYGTDGFHLSFPSHRAETCFLLGKQSLDEPVWTLLRGYVAGGDCGVFCDPSSQNPQRFYVIRTGPKGSPGLCVRGAAR